MSLPSPSPADVLNLFVGGGTFAVKRSVLTAEPDSMLAAMFGGEWNEANGDTDDKGNRILKGVRAEYFALLLKHYLEPRAIENTYGLKHRPHPMVTGPNSAEYRETLVYLGMNRAAEESTGCVQKWDTTLWREHVTYLDGGKTAVVATRANGTSTWWVASQQHTIGTEASMRLKLYTSPGVDFGDQDRALYCLGALSMPVTAGKDAACYTGTETHSELRYTTKSMKTLDELLEECVFMNSYVNIHVTADGDVHMCVEDEKGGKSVSHRVLLGRLRHTEGWYRFAMSFKQPGSWATIVPPKDVQTITL